MIDSFLDWLDPAAGIPFTFLNGTFWLFLWAVIIGFGLLNRLEKRIQARNAFLFAVRRGRFRSGKFDLDLLPSGHPLKK